MIASITAASAWGWYYGTRGLPLLFALSMLPASYYIKVQDETTVGYTFRWLDWVCLECPLLSASLAYGLYSAMYPYSELTTRSRWWWNGAMFVRFTYYLVPLSMGVHSAATIVTWALSLWAWHETSSRRVWHRPVTHVERYCVYWPVGLAVSVTSGHVGECVSAFLAWKKFGSIGTIVIVMIVGITLLHAAATVRFGVNLGFVTGTVWETCIIMSVSLGHHNRHVFSTAASCALLLLVLSCGLHYKAHRRAVHIPAGAVEYYAKKVELTKEEVVVSGAADTAVLEKTRLSSSMAIKQQQQGSARCTTAVNVAASLPPATRLIPGKRTKLTFV